ncbi:MAG: hypothetical protein FJY34_13420 [Betaproteobacteria bacterium]|nr:hypothetical protein [Betaproteobacteria bacterium]
MTSENITIHLMKTAQGENVQYARIKRKFGNTLIFQSVMISRLSQEQLKKATPHMATPDDEDA